MAIIPELPGVEVTVRVAGEVAREYDDLNTTQKQGIYERSGTKICNKFIESSDDAPFTIYMRVTGNYRWGHKNHSLKISTYLDGNWAKGEYCREWNTRLGYWSRTVSHRVVRNDSGELEQQGFTFVNLTQLKGQQNHDQRKDEQMGTIEVRFDRVIENGNNDNNSDHQPQVAVAAGTEVKKGVSGDLIISHGTGYSNPKKLDKAPRYVDCTHLPEDNGPIAIFRFSYRSFADLCHILRPIPTSSPANPFVRALELHDIFPQPPALRPLLPRPPPGTPCPPGPSTPLPPATPSRPSGQDPRACARVALAGLSQDEIEDLAVEMLRVKRGLWVDEASKSTFGPSEHQQGQNTAKRARSELGDSSASPPPRKMPKTAEKQAVIVVTDTDTDSDYYGLSS